MSSKIFKSQPRGSGVRRSKRLQERLLNVAAVPSPVGAGITQDALHEQLLNAVDLPPSPGAGLLQGAPTGLSRGQLNDIDQSPTEETQFINAQGAEVKDEGSVDKPRQAPFLQHPRPNRPYAPVLKNFIDPLPSGSNPADSTHNSVLRWLETVGLDRDTRCRSDSHLNPAEDRLIPRRSTRSAPAMGRRKDAASGAASPTSGASSPASIPTVSRYTPDLTVSSSSTLVEQAIYRSVNLKQNHIYLRCPHDALPAHIADLVAMARKARQTPGPSLEEIRRDAALVSLELGAGEPGVQSYFQNHILPPNLEGRLMRSDRHPMLKHAVPTNPQSGYRVSGPVPDMIYGYNRSEAFTASQQVQLASMGNHIQANAYDLLYPFFVLEFKGDGPAKPGSLWVATNQCLGASATCVNMADWLNRQLRQCKDITVQEVNTAAFSIATNGSDARVFITWKHDDQDFYMQKVRGFHIQDPEQYLEFHKYIWNILDWGENERLKMIGDSLGILLEERRKRTSAVAKSRPPPHSSHASTSSSGRSKSRKS